MEGRFATALSSSGSMVSGTYVAVLGEVKAAEHRRGRKRWSHSSQRGVTSAEGRFATAPSSIERALSGTCTSECGGDRCFSLVDDPEGGGGRPVFLGSHPWQRGLTPETEAEEVVPVCRYGLHVVVRIGAFLKRWRRSGGRESRIVQRRQRGVAFGIGDAVSR